MWKSFCLLLLWSTIHHHQSHHTYKLLMGIYIVASFSDTLVCHSSRKCRRCVNQVTWTGWTHCILRIWIWFKKSGIIVGEKLTKVPPIHGQCYWQLMHWAVYISVLFVCYDTSERSTVAAARAGWNMLSWFGESSGSRRNCHGAGSKPNRGFKLPLDVGGAPLEQTGAAGVNHRLFSCILSELSHKMVFSD